MTQRFRQAIMKRIKEKRKRVHKMCQDILGQWHSYNGEVILKTQWMSEGKYGQEYSV